MSKGEVWIKYVRGQHGWSLEKRRIIDASDTMILYECVDDFEGTSVEPNFEPIQLSLQDWNNWSKTAEKI